MEEVTKRLLVTNQKYGGGEIMLRAELPDLGKELGTYHG